MDSAVILAARSAARLRVRGLLGVSDFGACRGAPFSRRGDAASSLLPAASPSAAASFAARSVVAALSAPAAGKCRAAPPFWSLAAVLAADRLLGAPAAAKPAAKDRRAKPGAGSGLAAELVRLLVGEACTSMLAQSAASVVSATRQRRLAGSETHSVARCCCVAASHSPLAECRPARTSGVRARLPGPTRLRFLNCSSCKDYEALISHFYQLRRLGQQQRAVVTVLRERQVHTV